MNREAKVWFGDSMESTNNRSGLERRACGRRLIGEFGEYIDQVPFIPISWSFDNDLATTVTLCFSFRSTQSAICDTTPYKSLPNLSGGRDNSSKKFAANSLAEKSPLILAEREGIVRMLKVHSTSEIQNRNTETRRPRRLSDECSAHPAHHPSENDESQSFLFLFLSSTWRLKISKGRAISNALRDSRSANRVFRRTDPVCGRVRSTSNTDRDYCVNRKSFLRSLVDLDRYRNSRLMRQLGRSDDASSLFVRVGTR